MRFNPNTTRKQREALYRLFTRAYDTTYETPRDLLRQYRKFRRTIGWRGGTGDQYLVACLWGMVIGIESDGYTHS